METQPQPAYLQETACASTSLSPVECVDDERDEAQMIVAVLNGQAGVFAELVRPYEPMLFRVAFTDAAEPVGCGRCNPGNFAACVPQTARFSIGSQVQHVA